MKRNSILAHEHEVKVCTIPRLEMKYFEQGMTKIKTKYELSGKPIVYILKDESTIEREAEVSEVLQEGDSEYIIVLNDHINDQCLVKYYIKAYAKEIYSNFGDELYR